MRKVSIYDPAMCCPTGMCGINISPDIVRVANALHALQKNGVEVKRYNLTSSPQAFVVHPDVCAFINTQGVQGLPLTLVDEKIVLSGRYPTNGELAGFLDIPEDMLATLPSALKINAGGNLK
jgi:hypothetical protein